MAAAYNHRVHMDPSDMPAMHMVDVANGVCTIVNLCRIYVLCFIPIAYQVNALGYYMYHGGTNPHPLASGQDSNAPENTLQESSFQPAGAANPMPSFRYLTPRYCIY